MVGPWVSGQSGNPNGRPKGSRNKRTEEIFNRLEARGDLDPADLLSSIVTNQQEPKELRIQAAGLLMSYKYSKPQATPSRIYVDEQIVLPHPDPRTITQSNENILYLSNLKAQGQIDLLWGDNLIADQCRVRDGLIDDAKLAIQGHEQGDQIIRIEGGLPALPGTNVTMPHMIHNGHQFETLPAPAPVIESTAPESVDHDTKDQGQGP
jgi:hypothetical protein